MFNAGNDCVDFRVPEAPDDRHWHRVVDTHRLAPEDIASPGTALRLDALGAYRIEPRAGVILATRR